MAGGEWRLLGPRRRGRVERRWREDRGAEEMGVKRGCPLPIGGRVWGGSFAPSQKIFRFFDFLSSKRRVLVHSGTDKIYF